MVFIADIRSKEKHFLQLTAYAQSISNAFTPAIPIVAVIATFLTHIALGYDLSPAEVSIMKVLLSL